MKGEGEVVSQVECATNIPLSIKGIEKEATHKDNT
jgi:hypothetical protein